MITALSFTKLGPGIDVKDPGALMWATPET